MTRSRLAVLSTVLAIVAALSVVPSASARRLCYADGRGVVMASHTSCQTAEAVVLQAARAYHGSLRPYSVYAAGSTWRCKPSINSNGFLDIVCRDGQRVAGIAVKNQRATLSATKRVHHRHRRHHKPPPQSPSLKPIVITVYGQTVSICDSGWPSVCEAPSTAVATATCPDGYSVIGGGWESSDSPVNVTVTNSHIVGNGWLVVMQSNRVSLQDRPDVAYFRATAQCMILVPA